jgi:hypothetical protein
MANEDAIRQFVREIVRQALSESMAASPGETPQSPSAYFAPWTGIEYEAHPSRGQFNINEATLNTSDLLEFVESKLCQSKRTNPATIAGCAAAWDFDRFGCQSLTSPLAPQKSRFKLFHFPIIASPSLPVCSLVTNQLPAS